MADTQGSWSFTDVKNKSGVVTSRTGTYKIGTTTAATITGLSPTVTTSNITVNDTNGTIQLGASAFGESAVKLTKGNYTLGFLGDVPGMNGIQITDPKMTVSNGTVTVKGTMEKGYTLAANKKSIAYSAKKENTTLATINGLDTALKSGKDSNGNDAIGIETTTGEGENAVTTITPAVTLDNKTVTFTQVALKDGNVTFKNNAGGYTFALDGVATPVTSNGTWSINTSKGTATYTGDVSKGHTLSLDGKTVNFTAEKTSASIVTVSGVKKDADAADSISIETVTNDSHYGAKITLKADALTTGAVTVGAGYQLALNADVSQNPVATNDVWAVNKTNAIYKQVTPAYYTYDATTNKITYTKQADLQTYATVSGLKNGIKVGDDGSVGIDVNSTFTTGIKLGTIGDNGEFSDATPGKIIQLTEDVLGTKKITVTGTGYTLTTDEVTAPTTSNEVWSRSGTTATLKGNITAGWTQTDDTTITYVAAATNERKPATLATVKGLNKDLVVGTDGTTSALGTNLITTADDGAGGTTTTTTFVPGLEKSGDNIIIANNVVGTTNITLTPAAGFNYALVLDDGSEKTISGGGGKVATSATDRTFWVINGASLYLKDGKEAYFTAADSKTINYTAPVPDKKLATVMGLKTDLKVNSNYEIEGGYVSVNGKTITVTEEALNAKDVTVTGSNGYTFYVDDNLNSTEKNLWTIENKIAYYKAYDSEGYAVTDRSAKIAYTAQKYKSDIAEISGLKNGIKVKADGTINGIDVDDNAKTIKLSKSVLGTTDVALTSDSTPYSLALNTDVAQSTTTGQFVSANNKGTAKYRATTTAGFVLDTTTNTATYNKQATVNLTLNGLASTISVSEGDITGITTDLTTKTFTLSDSVLDKNVTLTGNGYTLALDGSVDSPTFAAGKWTTKTTKNVTTATLNGTVSSAGYQASADGKTVNYFRETATASGNITGSSDATESTAPESVVLATITGLNGNVTANSDGSIDGITLNNSTQPTKFTLSKDVLGTSKVTVSGGNYTLALDGTVPTAVKEDHVGWVTSGTTATLKKYDRGFYTLDDTKSTLNYTADTKGTTYATIKGIKSGVDILSNLGDSIIGTITLSKNQLDGKKVTITNSNGGNIKLALASDVPKKAVATTGWVTSGTTANYKNYTEGYYKLSGGNTINYTAATKGSTIATIKGIKSGAEITSVSAKEVTLGADQLDGKSKKITITGDGYTLKLGDDVTKSTVEETAWNTTEVKNRAGETQSVNATYDQTTSAGYTLANSTTITYAADETTTTLAKITGLNAEADADALATGIEAGTNSEDTKVLTLKDKDILGNTVKLTSSEYIFAMDGTNVTEPAEQSQEKPWTVNKNGTAKYNVTMTEGFVLAANGKQLTKKAETEKTLLTLSGLNKTAIAELEDFTGNTTEQESLDGIAVDTEEQTVTFSKDTYLTKRVTLGKKDEFSFVLDGVTEPEAYTNPKWTVSTVKGTTKAVLREGMEAGYELANENKTVVLTAEKAGDTVATLTGLVKGLKVSDDKQKLTFTNSDKTVSEVVTYNKSSHAINLLAKSLGKSDVTLESDDYSIASMGGNEPVLGEKSWVFNNGTATYSQVQIAGYTLEGDGKSVTYTAPKTTTFITVKGLEKTFSGDANSSLVADNTNYVVIVKPDILGTSKVTIAVPKNSTAYTLNLDSDVAQQADLKEAQWVTNGTTAQYKDYNSAYYLVANGNKAINYYKAKDVKVYATVKGIASGADLSNAFSGDTTGGTITLNSTMVGPSNITLSGKGFALALDDTDSSLYTTEQETAQTAWVTSGTTATYKEYVPGYYTNNAAGTKITYTKGTGTETSYATIAGVNGKLTATLDENTSTFTVNGNQLGKKITVNGDPSNSGNSSYAFNITNYSQGTINGSKNADDITTSDNVLSISTGDGDDTITVGGMYVTVNAGAGDDTITTNKGNNVFVFAKNQGNDTITGFKKTDELKTSGATATAEINGDDVVVTLGTGTITLTNAASLSAIKINGVQVTPTDPNASSNVLLADNNYSMDAANLSSLVQADISSYTPYDFTSNFSLTKEDKLTPQISYSGNDK